jgi:predicted histone-like DNA-binding protein
MLNQYFKIMLTYKLTERGLPNDPQAPKKLYASPVSKGRKSIQAISKDLADISSLSRGDVQNVLMNLVDQIPKYLLDGQSVSLGELGSMRLSFSSEGVENEGQFNTNMVKNMKIIFTPGTMLKDAMGKAAFEKEK